MDLLCTQPWMRGRTQWVEGFAVPIGLDGFARGLPPDVANELLTIPEHWSLPSGEVPAGPIVPSIVIGPHHDLVPPLPQVPLMPKTRALLSSLEVRVLEGIGHQLDLDLEDAGAHLPGDMVSAILDRLDQKMAEDFGRLALEVTKNFVRPETPLPPPPTNPTPEPKKAEVKRGTVGKKPAAPPPAEEKSPGAEPNPTPDRPSTLEDI